MSLSRSLIFSGAALAAISTAAWAADMPGYPPFPAPPPPPLHTYSGWYLRGDLGYRKAFDSSVQPAPGFPGPTSDNFDGSATVGFGGGIKTDWLRTDVTIDFGTPMKYRGSIVAPEDTSAKVSATTILLNGYFDLGTWYHATPYIGGGVGTARVTVNDYSSTAAPPFSGDSSRSQWNFAWAGTAGVGYAISPSAMVDVAYRYVNFGDATTGSDIFGSMTLKNLAAHEVRVGLRWSFDDLLIAH